MVRVWNGMGAYVHAQTSNTTVSHFRHRAYEWCVLPRALWRTEFDGALHASEVWQSLCRVSIFRTCQSSCNNSKSGSRYPLITHRCLIMVSSGNRGSGFRVLTYLDFKIRSFFSSLILVASLPLMILTELVLRSFCHSSCPLCRCSCSCSVISFIWISSCIDCAINVSKYSMRIYPCTCMFQLATLLLPDRTFTARGRPFWGKQVPHC